MWVPWSIQIVAGHVPTMRENKESFTKLKGIFHPSNHYLHMATCRKNMKPPIIANIANKILINGGLKDTGNYCAYNIANFYNAILQKP